VLRLVPPLVVTAAEVDQAVAIITEVGFRVKGVGLRA
jgi:4-aminobutyrate aminotransferase-like enzyme